MSKPTANQISSEMKALREMKPRVRKETAFGEDNHAAIEAQIQVLGGALDLDDMDEKLDDDEWTQYAFDSAREALEWMEGDEEISPSENWAPLAKEVQP